MAGLPAPSIVRAAKIATVEARDAQRLGVLPLADCDTVSSNIRRTLAVALGGSDHDEH
jgi:mRNA interferase MazF